MNTTNDIAAKHPASILQPRPSSGRSIFCFGLFCLVLLLAVSKQSFWIDETSTGLRAMQPTLQGWWHEMKTGMGSDLQMPLYMIYVWASAKILGSGEWSIRMAGFFATLPGLFAFIWVFKKCHERLALMLAIGTSAFAWYYLNEARPYAMQLGATCLIVSALKILAEPLLSPAQTRTGVYLFLAGVVALCGTSLLGVIWSGGALVALWTLVPAERIKAILRAHLWSLVATLLLLLALGGFYLWTLKVGARASGAAKTDLPTLAFVFYEQLGFAGLGPGRTEMRQAGIKTLASSLPILGVYFLLLAAVVIAGVRSIQKQVASRRFVFLCLALAIPAAALIGAAMVTHFRLLGRHCTPLMPAWYIVFAAGIISLWQSPRLISKLLVVSFLAVSLYSCLSIRFAQRHLRDDYASASAAAREALSAGQQVWWNAAEVGAGYYQVPYATNSAAPDKAVLMVNPPDSLLTELSKPQLVVASKIDLYDNQGALARFLKKEEFYPAAKFPAFTLWRPKAK